MFLIGNSNWKKKQSTRDLKDDIKKYQGLRLPCKNDQGYYDPTTRTQATIVWFPEDTCTTFQLAKIHARIHPESISYDKVNPENIRQNNYQFNNIHNIESKLSPFQIYLETEPARKYITSFYKTQYSEILVEYAKGFDMNTGKLLIIQNPTHHKSLGDENSYIPVTLLKKTERTDGKLRPQEKSKKTFTRTVTYEQYLFWCSSL